MTALVHSKIASFKKDARGVDFFFENNARMRVALLAQIVRVRVTSAPHLAPRRSWDVALADDAFEQAPFEVKEDASGFVIAASEILVRIARSGGLVTFENTAGETFACDVAAPSWSEMNADDWPVPMYPGEEFIPEGPARSEVTLKKAMAPGEAYLGFGQRTYGLDRRGSKVTNWTVDPTFGHGRGHDNLYQTHPVFMALRKSFAWGIFLHSTWLSRFDVGYSNWDELEISTLGGELDYYVIYGPTPAEFIDKLTRLTGRPMMPPLWSLGYHQSRWSYMNEGEVKDLVTEFRERKIPLDVMHLDIDYMHGYRCFTWDPVKFSDPKKLMTTLASQNVRVVTIIDPGIKMEYGTPYKAAEELSSFGGFIKDKFNSPYVGNVWPDRVLFPDFTREDTRRWWGEKFKGHLELGVAGIWQDMNEPANFDRPFSEAKHLKQRPLALDLLQGSGDETVTHAEVHNLYGYLMCRATHEGLKKLAPNTRPWTLTRSAFTGVQKYSTAWMGDNNSWWEHLENSLPQLTSMGLCGLPHVGVDIGGFWGNSNPELYARWVQLGTFYPFMRTHCAMKATRQEPWSFGTEVEDIARKAIELRYKLLPYLYTLAHESHATGAPILRPLLYDFPHDEETWRRDDQVMFGPHMLVAPIVRPGQHYRGVYLPAGDWYDFHSGARVMGGGALATYAPLDRIPLYIKAGAALPFGQVRQSTNEPLSELTWHIYPGPKTCSRLVEDDGASFGFEKGETATTTVLVDETQTGLLVHIDARQGKYKTAQRALVLRIYRESEPRNVKVSSGDRHTAAYNRDEGCFEIKFEVDSGHEIEVKLEYA